MAEIIELEARRPNRRYQPVESRREARLLFFTGVRYERLPDAPTRTQTEERGAKTRRPPRSAPHRESVLPSRPTKGRRRSS
ncbi:hypothetical protein FJU11_00450 [Pararhizobium mangrovi]|uniref:Uncharacterized protein n=1 Tax=Pararhizobium mangrovi TaxID=2590452 RepID=A0A506UHE9_9HYPH|nr:hypothetical protein FJU11_00450 [Pararhizobium mangrovi]